MGKIEFNFNQLTSPNGVKQSEQYKGDVKKTPPAWGLLPGIYKANNLSFPSLGKETIHSQMPMRVKKKGATNWFTFPLEPIVSVSSKNVIVRRNVAKAKDYGTIKERWSQDDFEVTIEGILTNTEEKEYPESLVNQLLILFREKQEIEVDQNMLLTLGIKFLAIQAIDFPHTQGVNNQRFIIKAYSDTQAELLINS